MLGIDHFLNFQLSSFINELAFTLLLNSYLLLRISTTRIKYVLCVHIYF